MEPKKLLVLLGAGSSIEQEFPSVGDLDQEMTRWAEERAQRIKFPNYYARLWENRAKYCEGLNPQARELAEPRIAPNYERVLGDLEILMNSALGIPFGDPLLQWLTKASVLQDLGMACDDPKLTDKERSRHFHGIEGQVHALRARLAERIRMNSNGFRLHLQLGHGEAAFAPYRHLFQTLAETFSLGVYNLNYDTVALTALPESFVGFDRRTRYFLQSEVHSRPEWNFLYHLHGSVHHRIRRGSNRSDHANFGVEITWDDDLSQTGDAEDWNDVGDLATGTDGKRYLPTTLVAGGWKLDHLQGEPFLTFYSRLVGHLNQADAILIAGYGFGDPHINSVLASVLRCKATTSVRPPIVVPDHHRDRLGFAKRGAEPKVIAMGRALRAPIHFFRAPTHRGEPHWEKLPDIVPPDEFEQPLPHDHPVPVAVWNGGLLAASPHASRIARWLAGDISAL